MKYSSDIILLKTYIIILIATSCSSWQLYPSMNDYALADAIPDPDKNKHEYIYGDCATVDKKFYTHVHIDSAQVTGKIVLRGWLDIPRIPTCIILTAQTLKSEEDVFRSTAYSFQFCIPRVTFCHTQRRYNYYYYEWFIPFDMISGMDWDIYLYGPDKKLWE